MSPPVIVWGVPFAPITLGQVVDEVEKLIDARRPSYFITANTQYAMLSAETPGLAAVSASAAFVVADGKPIVWASRLLGTPLPERVAGSDLIYALAARAADRGHRLFLLGGAEGVADEVGRRLSALYPGLVIAGTACPPHRPLSDEEHRALLDSIREARADILLAAFSQPRGEMWVAENAGPLGIPVVAQLGASFDFVVGRVRRAPKILQKLGMEWAYRMAQEPRRLAPRYARNARFLAAVMARDLASIVRRRPAARPGPTGPAPASSPSARTGAAEP